MAKTTSEKAATVKAGQHPKSLAAKSAKADTKTKSVAKGETSKSKAAGKVAKQAAGAKTNSAAKSAASRAETARHSRGSVALASVQQPQVQAYPDRFGTTDTTGSIPANFPNPPKSNPVAFRMPALFASPDPVMEARRWIGTNPTDRSTLWCARFMNFVLERSGFKGTGSVAHHGSGEIFAAFATSGERSFPDRQLDPLFQAAVDATEEAVLCSLWAAVDTVGREGRLVRALPRGKVLELYRGRGR